eukprot:3649519-Alexandrium_andersonii.AAC.1
MSKTAGALRCPIGGVLKNARPSQKGRVRQDRPRIAVFDHEHCHRGIRPILGQEAVARGDLRYHV